MESFHDFVAPRNGLIECACGRTYTPFDEDDVHDHAAFHAEFERVAILKNHVPMPYAARERMKDAAREALRAAITDAEVLAPAELLVRAWYDRSLIRAIERGFGDEHPELAGYTKMLADDHQLDARACDVLALAYQYVRRPPGTIEATIWEPPLGGWTPDCGHAN